MPEMATVCQETNGTPPTMFSPRAPQGVGPPHNYYSHCGYPPPTSHGQYGPENYGHFQPSPEQSPHLQHHVHHQPQQHHQQPWGYGMGVGMMVNGRGGPGGLPDEWAQGYLVPGANGPSQNPYNYQYRGANPHGPLDYATPMHGGHEGDPQGMEGSPSPHTPSPGEPPQGGMGPNNQGAKSLRPPYEWMKPSAALPQAGHVSMFPGKTRTKDKYRVVYSDHQRLELEKEFHFSKYITIRRKAEIAVQLGLSERQVKIWFQNRRAKERKQNKKREEQQHIHTGGLNSMGNPPDQQQQQPLQQQSNHEPHPHFIPKLEIDEEKVNMHDMPCHSGNISQGAGLTSPPGPPTPIAMHPNLHSSPIMSVAPSIIGRSHSHSAMGRYHETLPRTTMSPASSADDVAYRMTSAADSSGNSMNLSSSSDSGVVSSH